MNARFFDEPELEFGTSQHVDVRFGIMNYGPLDFNLNTAPKKIKLGIVGTSQTVDKVCRWLDSCKNEIPAKKSKQPNLFPLFPGFNSGHSFQSEIALDANLQRTISPVQIQKALKSSDYNSLVKESVDLFLNEIKYLAENTNSDVIACCLPNELIEVIDGGTLETEDNYKLVFHDLLKAKSMELKRPIQVIRPTTYDKKTKMLPMRASENVNTAQTLQDDATIAWNIHTALYYKAGGVPWRLLRNTSQLDTCYVGVSFYYNLEKDRLLTSMAQVFNQRGEGIIVRGGMARIDTKDRQIHLSKEDSFALLKIAIERYKDEHKNLPARVVIHKSSIFNRDEIEGFQDVLLEKEIDYFDFLSISTTNTRLYRYGTYAPLRGTMLSMNDSSHILYTKGSVDFFQTYPGLYIPNPLLFRCDHTSDSPDSLAQEILSLTKMNWNNTQFDGSKPITLRASEQVGAILKYLDDSTKTIEAQYRYYM